MKWIIYGKRCFKISIFITGFILIFIYLSNLLKPKMIFDSEYHSPETEVWESFYKLPNNSIDVLFLGSSHVYNDINPLIIYEETGITSFNMVSSGQDIETSYFYLKEALKHQKPAFVIFETYGLLWEPFYNEPNYKTSLDYMRLSKDKIEDINIWLSKVEGEKKLYRIFPILDYHNRWEQLGSIDINYHKYEMNCNGYVPATRVETVVHDNYYNIMYNYDFHEDTIEWFVKIRELCAENNIEFIAVSNPCNIWQITYSEKMAELQQEYAFDFIDFNPEEVYSNIGFDLETDFQDPDHMNINGSTKFSTYLANFMVNYGIYPAEHSKKIGDYYNKQLSDWNAYLNQTDVHLP